MKCSKCGEAIDVAPLEKRFAIISELAASRGMENDELKERIAELEAEKASLENYVERMRKAQTCASCGSLICPPMQCGACIESSAPLAGMPARPVTEALKEKNAKLEAENQRLGEQLAHFKDCYASLASLYDKAQLERGGGDVE